MRRHATVRQAAHRGFGQATPLRIAVATPLSHAALSLLAPVLTSGGTFYVMEAFSPDAFYDLVEQHRITCTLLVPVMLYALQGHPRYETADMSSMATIFYGASPGGVGPRFYVDYTGTGNTVNLSHPRVLQMVMDSLRYWVEVCHVDGFRFDLATTLARGPNGFERNSGFFTAIRQDPVLASVKLVAEPWDLGMGGYQVGAFPSQWSEWNDRYRSAMRRYWAGEGSLIGEVSRRMTGSSDIFNHDSRMPRASVNHVTVHDGFTLADLFAYATKHNLANGEDNRDGSNDNHSVNFGVEGATDDAKILGLRRQLRKNQLACLLLAQGVPLLLAGDEAGNSQGGNNNAYCQDNETGWVDWSGLGRDDDMVEFVGLMTEIRRSFPQLRSKRWLDGRRADGSYGVLWLTPSAAEMTVTDWAYPDGRFLAYVLSPLEPGGDAIFIVLNSGIETIDFHLPKMAEYEAWHQLFDTTRDAVQVAPLASCRS